jgi:hypothetical protein
MTTQKKPVLSTYETSQETIVRDEREQSFSGDFGKFRFGLESSAEVKISKR